MVSRAISQSNLWTKTKSFLTKKSVLLSVWLLIAFIATSKQFLTNSYNNYLIFKYTYFHALEHVNLYIKYPEYQDVNHYGPFFSVLIAPFALLPDYIGMLLWQLTNTLLLFWAITKLPLKENQKIIMLWLCSHELLTSTLSFQINPSIAAILILTFVCIERKQDFWAALFIMLGTFVKLYGIVGLAFFFFSKQKMKFIVSCIFWAIILFILPMIFFSPTYIIQSYADWYQNLITKNHANTTLSSMQDISLMGLTRRLMHNADLPNLPFLISSLLLFSVPYLRIKQYKNLAFQLMFVASTLLFIVLFSTGSESPIYIIAFTGVALWFVVQPQPYKITPIVLLIFALTLTSFSPSDLFPRYLREVYVVPYALKALPCVLIWISIVYEMITKDFSLYTTKE